MTTSQSLPLNLSPDWGHYSELPHYPELPHCPEYSESPVALPPCTDTAKRPARQRARHHGAGNDELGIKASWPAALAVTSRGRLPEDGGSPPPRFKCPRFRFSTLVPRTSLPE